MRHEPYYDAGEPYCITAEPYIDTIGMWVVNFKYSTKFQVPNSKFQVPNSNHYYGPTEYWCNCHCRLPTTDYRPNSKGAVGKRTVETTKIS